MSFFYAQKIAVKCFFCLLIFTNLACGQNFLKKDKEFVVEMQAKAKSPETAEGNYDPDVQTYLINAITFEQSDGTLMKINDEPITAKINAREQIVFSTKIDDLLKDTTPTSVIIEFDSSVTTLGRYNKNLGLTLSQTTYTAPFLKKITTKDDIKININVLWGYTVYRDHDNKTETVSEPTIEVLAN